MSTAHTPGPWTAIHWEIRTESPGSEVIAILHGEYEANARLIAAAPAMLEALRDINARINALMEEETLEDAATPYQWGELCALLDISAAAIDKATGAQP